MKKFLLAAALLAGAPAYAQNPPEPAAEPEKKTGRQSGLYIGGGIATIVVDEEPYSLDPGWDTLQLRAGYNLNKYLGVEANLNIGLNAYITDGSDVYDTDGHDLTGSFGGFLIPRLPVGDVGIYGRLGYVINNYDFGTSGKTEASGPAVGVGIDVDFGMLTFYLDATALLLTSEDTVGSLSSGEYDATGGVLAIGVLGRF